MARLFVPSSSKNDHKKKTLRKKSLQRSSSNSSKHNNNTAPKLLTFRTCGSIGLIIMIIGLFSFDISISVQMKRNTNGHSYYTNVLTAWSVEQSTSNNNSNERIYKNQPKQSFQTTATATTPSNNTSMAQTTATTATTIPTTTTTTNNNMTTDNTPEQQQQKQQQDEKEFTYYFSHIPKAGGTYFFRTINKLFAASKERRALPPEEQFMLCNAGTALVSAFHTRYPSNWRGIKCTMWQSEDAYTDKAQHVYTVIRNPRQHVLSMYFHCMESRHHIKRAWKMPQTLEGWLEAWVDAMGNETLINENRRFDCYNPINVETRYTKFDPTLERLAAKEDLKRRYDILGDTDRMVEAVCAIYIIYTGWIPKACDCTNKHDSNATNTERRYRRLEGLPQSYYSNDTTIQTAGLQRQTRQQLRRHQEEEEEESFHSNDQHSRRQRRRRLLADESPKQPQRSQFAYDADAYSHGVKRHGGTFQTTPEQDELIAKLTNHDVILYELVKEIFPEQLEQVEKDYQIKICSEF